MWIFFDGQLIDSAKAIAFSGDRAFQYGDGLFETMVWQDDTPRWAEDHAARLAEGMHFLGYDTTAYPPDQMIRRATEVIRANELSGLSRVRIQVWRKPGGLYAPESGDAHVLISAKTIEQFRHEPVERASIAGSAFVSRTPFSRYKTCNALPYIYAGLERQRRGLDELLLCDADGYLSEAVSSNLFWVKKGKVFTPRLRTGCVAGITRQRVLHWLKNAGIPVEKVTHKPKSISEAKSVFLTNVTGVRSLLRIDEQQYTEWEMLPQLRSELF